MRDSNNPGKKDTKRSRKIDDECCKVVIEAQKIEKLNVDCPSHKGKQKECPPRAPGACIPVALGSKPKQSLSAKLGRIIENNPTPSVLAATIIHQLRRFLSGHNPGNTLEVSVFEVFDSLSPELKNTLTCILETFDDLPKDQRDSIFHPEIRGSIDQAPDPAQIADLLVSEIDARVAHEVFEDATCTEERPGLPRPIFSVIDGGNFLGFLPTICRINNLRTIYFEPALAPGEYEPDELQHVCTPELGTGEVVVNCEVQTENCPGHQLFDGTCLRVPDVTSGDIVVLEGVNFFNVEARVRLRAKPPGTISREIEAFVCGDQETPATEQIGGVDVPINDCRVHDRLTFQVPEEIPVGIYEVRVVIPNNTGVEGTDPEFISREIFINVLPPATARFQVASEELHAEKETSPTFPGSDEVAIRLMTVPVFADFSEFDDMKDTINFRFGDVDSGETFDMNRVLLTESGLSGIIIGIVGFEVDSEEAFERQIDKITDAFFEILKRVWNAIKDIIKDGVKEIVEKYGVKGIIAVVIGAVLTIAVIAIVAVWAPADLIVQDQIGLSINELAALTSLSFPVPAEVKFRTNGGIDVRVVPVNRNPQQYRERREYRSNDEDSEYHITIRYNRLA